MKENKEDYLVVPAIKIEQPLGVFYAVALQAEALSKIAFSVPAVAVRKEGESYEPDGTQRVLKEPRLKEIGTYIDTVEATFPNSIILGANYDVKTGGLVKESQKRWYVKEEHGHYSLHIPTSERLASLIDGQHRLKGFEYAKKHKTMPLLCAVFLGLPFPYHAYIFATINYNQKSVPKSLAYDLFGFDLDERESESWAPEMLAVFLTRIFERDASSPFVGHIKLGVLEDDEMESVAGSKKVWQVSLATIVDGILSLISSAPKRDRDEMHQLSVDDGRLRSALHPEETRPLRRYYLDVNDAAVFSIVNNYFQAVDNLMWQEATEKSYIKKTVGIQALFDILRLMLNDEGDFNSKDMTKEHFEDRLAEASKIKFDGTHFEASGIGKGLIKNLIALSCGLQGLNDMRDNEKRAEAEEILQSYGVVLPEVR